MTKHSEHFTESVPAPETTLPDGTPQTFVWIHVHMALPEPGRDVLLRYTKGGTGTGWGRVGTFITQGRLVASGTGTRWYDYTSRLLQVVGAPGSRNAVIAWAYL